MTRAGTTQGVVKASPWGGPPEVESEEIRQAVEDLKADLQAILQDLARGPVADMRALASTYVGELRREFLRPHRRLSVQTRTADDRDDVLDTLRRELVELTDRFRTVALSQASRVEDAAWTPVALNQAVRQAVQMVPGLIMAPYEDKTYVSQPSDSFGRRVSRALLRLDRRIRKMVRTPMPDRPVELRQLARYHLLGRAALQIEGLAALFVQSEVQVAGRSRQVLEAVVQGVEGLVSHVEEDDFPDMVSGLRISLEDEFASVEREVNQVLDDSSRRAESIYADALIALKDDLPVYATVDLSAHQRRSGPIVEEAKRALAEVAVRMERLRKQVAAGYVLLALHLEFAGFRARVQQTMAGVLAELRADVRGRSWLQLDRVRIAVDEVLHGLSGLEGERAEGADASTDDSGSADVAVPPVDDAEVRALVEPLEHLLEEASAVTRQLLDQLSAETAVTPLLEVLNREAHDLTDRYTVPVGRVSRAEWKLPAPVGLTEIEFAAVVSDFVQREIAPELLATTNRAMKRVLPILDVFQDLERVVSFNAEALDDRDDVSAPTPNDQHLGALLQSTLQRSRDALTERLEETEHWDEDLAADIRKIVLAKLDALRRRLDEEDIGRARVTRPIDSRLQLIGQVNRFQRSMQQLQTRVSGRLQEVIGDERMAAWRGVLGLPQPVAPPFTDGSAWAPPRRIENLPVVYSRLFAARARWAGDVLNVPDTEIARAREALANRASGPRVAAIIGVDAATRGALVGAVLRGGKPSRRMTFTQPTSVEQIRNVLADVSSGSVVQLSGLGWLMRARPGGFAPLRILLEFIVKDERRSAWMLEADALVWQFVASATPLADIFATQIRVPALRARDLEKAILARHNLSGYELRFASGDQEEVFDEAQRGPLSERYFQALYAASGGLLQVALPMWLGSLGRVTEEPGLAVVNREPSVPLSALLRLPEATWTVLFVTARQGWIDASTLAFVLQIDRATAEGRLAGLAGLGLLERPMRDVYQIRRHLRGAVVRGLGELGWL